MIVGNKSKARASLILLGVKLCRLNDVGLLEGPHGASLVEGVTSGKPFNKPAGPGRYSLKISSTGRSKQEENDPTQMTDVPNTSFSHMRTEYPAQLGEIVQVLRKGPGGRDKSTFGTCRTKTEPPVLADGPLNMNFD